MDLTKANTLMHNNLINGNVTASQLVMKDLRDKPTCFVLGKTDVKEWCRKLIIYVESYDPNISVDEFKRILTMHVDDSSRSYVEMMLSSSTSRTLVECEKEIINIK